VGEKIVLRRDADGRIVGISMADVDPTSVSGTSSSILLRAAAEALREYIHVSVEQPNDEELNVDRSDVHLDREIDAILETLRIGLRIVEKEYPSELAITEAQDVEIKV